jgi:hypothetical protein
MITVDEINATGLSLDDHGAIAEALSAGRTKIVSKPIGIGTVLAVMAPAGGEFLNALEALAASDSNVKWTLKLIEQGNFDVGMSVVRTQLEAFASEHVELADAINALLAVAIAPDPVTSQEVTRALEGN